MKQQNVFHQIIEQRVEVTKLMDQYWELYSNIDTWQFWFNLLMLIIPLLVLYFLLDRRRVFEIGFYGFAIHSLGLYLDVYGIKEGLWSYPYQLSVKFAANLALDASLIPIFFMLIYQYTYHKPKVFYPLTLLGMIFFAYLFKPFLVLLDLFWMSENMNYSKLFFVYFVGIGSAVVITNIFHKLSKQ